MPLSLNEIRHRARVRQGVGHQIQRARRGAELLERILQRGRGQPTPRSGVRAEGAALQQTPARPQRHRCSWMRGGHRCSRRSNRIVHALYKCYPELED